MLEQLALILEIQISNPKLPAERAREYADWVLEEASKRSLDPWIFHAIFHTETRWKAGIVVHEKDGTCSVGLGGANVPCRSPQVQVLRDPHRNIQWVGTFLTRIRNACHHNCSGLGWLRAYNGGNRDYVPKLVQPIVDRCHAIYDDSIPICDLPPRLYPPWVCRPEED